MAKDIFEGMGSAANVTGGAGRLVWAPYGQAIPTSFSDVIDLSTMSLQPGYKDFGFTDGPIEVSRSVETTDVEVEQSDVPIDSYVSGGAHGVVASLKEQTIENKQIAMMGAQIIETPIAYGTATTTTAAAAIGAVIIPVTSATGIVVGKYIDVDGQIRQVSAINGLNVTISKALTVAVASGGSVKPVSAFASKKLVFGSKNNRQAMQVVLLSQTRQGAITMSVFHNVKVSGEEITLSYGKEDRVVPLNLVAYPDPALDNDGDVFFELNEVIPQTP